jgi:hypothetical protein
VPPVLFFAIVYHIDVLVLIIILKIRFKEAETEAYKALLGAGLVLVGLILSGYLLILDRQRNDIE